MAGELEGRIAVVTAAASGMGRDTCLRFADEGAHVVAIDIDADAGAALIAGQGRTGAGDGGLAAAGRSGSQENGRVVGRNYIVVQSYPDISTANEAREHLAKSGISCTVEKGLSFAPRWYCVVTLAGFEKVSSREYEDCVRKIQSASNRFVSPKFKKFEPQAYRWR